MRERTKRLGKLSGFLLALTLLGTERAARSALRTIDPSEYFLRSGVVGLSALSLVLVGLLVLGAGILFAGSELAVRTLAEQR